MQFPFGGTLPYSLHGYYPMPGLATSPPWTERLADPTLN